MNRLNIVAEVGINHVGSLENAKMLADAAAAAGCDYVKFQKLTPAGLPRSTKVSKKDTLWGRISYEEYKRRMEFSEKQIKELVAFCDRIGLGWFFSVFDLRSAQFISSLSDTVKIPSCLLANIELLQFARASFRKVLISTGMSTEEEVVRAVDICNPCVIYHTISAYPCPVGHLRLGRISWLLRRFPNRSIGYSDHSVGFDACLAALGLGATWLEKHITLSHEMWGTDQPCSLEPRELSDFVQRTQALFGALGGKHPRYCYKIEEQARDKLRGRR